MTIASSRPALLRLPPARTGSRPRRHIIGLAIFGVYAAIVPIDRLLLADSSISVPVWRGFLLLLVLCVLFKRRARPPFAAVWLSALILIPLGGAISGLTTSVSESFTIGLQLGLLCGLAPFVFRYYLENSRAFLWIVGSAFILSQTVSAVVAMMQLAGASVFDTTLIFGRTTGLAGHPNVLAIMAVIAVIACTAALGHVPRLLLLPVLAIAGVNAAALVFSGSLSAMMAAVVACFLLLAVRRHLIGAFLVVVLGAAGVAAVASIGGLNASEFLDPISQRVDVVLGTSNVSGGAASLSTRVLTYEWAWRFIGENPLVGVGMDSLNAGTYNGYTPVHNYILHAWYRGGLFFMIWQLMATVAYIGLIIRSLRTGRCSAASALVAAVVTFAATSAFYDQQQYWLPLLLGVACFAPRKRTLDKPVAQAV